MAGARDDERAELHDAELGWTLAYEGAPVGAAADGGGYRCPACDELLSLGSMQAATRLRINCDGAGGHQWTAEGPDLR